MAVYSLSCPRCAARLKSNRLLQAEEQIRCPKCRTGFTASAVEIAYWAPKQRETQLPDTPRDQADLADILLQECSTAEASARRNRNLIIGSAAVLAALVLGLVLLIRRLGHEAATVEGSPETHVTTDLSNYAPGAQTPAADATLGQPQLLGHDVIARWTAFIEWLLDIDLNEEQRQECKTRFVHDWDRMDQSAKDAALKVFSDGLPAHFDRLSNYARNLLRAERLPKYLAELHHSSGHEFSRWLLAIYESAHKPGGPRNPVLASGDQPLTRVMVTQYCDFVDWVLDLRATGGLTAEQRQSLQDAVVTAWPRMAKAEKDRFVKLLENWGKVIQLDDGRRVKYQRKSCGEFLAQLRRTPNQDPGRWLLALYDHEQEIAKQQSEPKAVAR